MRLRFIFLLSILLYHEVSAQDYRFLVRFKDKNNTGYSPENPSSFLSAKSILRRQRQNIPIDSTDLPVSSAYADSLASIPLVKVLNRSRWFNLVLISIPDTSILRQVRTFSFVASSEPVNNQFVAKKRDSISVNQIKTVSQKTFSETATSISGLISATDYGGAFAQVHMHHGEFLHNQGFQGEGMTIAILDNGFNNYSANPAFDSLRVHNRILGSYDFVHQKVSVDQEGQHGAFCFSIIASDIPGTMIGTAPSASYWLFKTEDDDSETPVEEQNWVAAAEFADSAGADLITTSLGYGYFDDSGYDLTYSERNGHTALVSQAANLAVAKGMIVTASAGNSGIATDDQKYVSCPADGDSVYAVGAIDYNGVIAGFSSWGPNGSGQVKPDGVSVGSGTVFIGTDGNLYSGAGTSFSNPNLAGLIICLWEAFPENNPHDILSAVRVSSNQYDHPDGRYGYGIPDFEKAYQVLQVKRNAMMNPLTSNNWIRVFPVPFLDRIYVYILPSVSGIANIQLLDASGKLLLTKTVTVTNGQQKLIEYPIGRPLPHGTYFVRYEDKRQTKTLKLLKK
jgi:serine protease AprX